MRMRVSGRVGDFIGFAYRLTNGWLLMINHLVNYYLVYLVYLELAGTTESRRGGTVWGGGKLCSNKKKRTKKGGWTNCRLVGNPTTPASGLCQSDER